MTTATTKRGRPHIPYRASNGKYIDGLARRRDGRWRIVETGGLFSEPNETKAIRRFRDAVKARSFPMLGPMDEFGTQEIIPVDWSYFAAEVLERPEYVAKMTGIPWLANKAHTAPKPSIRLTKLLAIYLDNATCGRQSKCQVAARFRDFIRRTGAKTLDDLTQETLRAFRTEMVKTYKPATVKFYFGCIRTVLNRAMREGADADQINAVKLRMKLLYAPENHNANDPHPISRADVHTLLNSVEMTDTPQLWRAMLLLGLNAALYMEDLCALQWSELNLEAGTYLSRRKKRGSCIRAAVLWRETVEALRALPKHGESPYVFTSRHGTRYNRNTKIDDFRDFREKAGVATVKWAHIRDGAYTAACNAAGVDEKFARLLAGHRAPGLQDRYVQRNPKCVEPACSAVYRAYFGSERTHEQVSN